MDYALLIVWLVSIFGTGSPVLAKLNNENLIYIQYAHTRAIDENISPVKFVKLLNCESGWDKTAIGDKGKANGIAQFHKRTYDTFADNYGLVGSYKNPYSQINLASQMISDGLANQWWNCSHSVGFLK
jgi:hypothetical protein